METIKTIIVVTLGLFCMPWGAVRARLCAQGRISLNKRQTKSESSLAPRLGGIHHPLAAAPGPLTMPKHIPAVSRTSSCRTCREAWLPGGGQLCFRRGESDGIPPAVMPNSNVYLEQLSGHKRMRFDLAQSRHHWAAREEIYMLLQQHADELTN